jgi:nucleotide-binding universal stress UspA family protein
VAPIWIVGVDGSELSLAGLGTAAALACRAGAESIVVHVRHVPATCVEYPSALAVARPAVLEQEDSARAAAHSVLAGGDVNWRFDVREGNPADELIAAAREAHAELIAIRGHGHTGLGHLLLGSVALRLLEHATTNVLILH